MTALPGTGPRSPWIWVPRPRAGARLRLVCFPFAGGGPAAWMGWLRHLPETVELWCIAPPGCELREHEPALVDFASYVEEAAGALLEAPPGPIALFGHSLGAATAYEVTLRLVDAGRPPVHLFLSAKESPDLPTAGLRDLHRLDDAALTEATRALFGGLPAELEETPELMASVLQKLRLDLRLVSQVPANVVPRLLMPVSVLWSPDDRAMSEEQVRAWQRRVAGPVRFASYPGGHFFATERPAEVLRFVLARLREHLD